MPTRDDIRWFKQQFGATIDAAIAATPFSLDLIVAVACQETGYIWQVLRTQPLSTDRILALCVGDTLDASGGRRAFPKTKTDLVGAPRGDEMFAIARAALVDMSAFIPGYATVAKNPNKFCHGFGVFQYDLQFFKSDPDYFLDRRYADFTAALGKCLGELDRARVRAGLQDEVTLSDFQMACVAIAYNSGGFKPSKGLKQGYFNGSRYYGEEIFDFLRLSQTVSAGEAHTPLRPQPVPGSAALPPPSPVAASGPFYEVDVRDTPLRLRSTPKIDRANPTVHVIARLPDGQIVRAVTNEQMNGFVEVETSLNGAHHRGFAAAEFLKPAPSDATIAVQGPAPLPPRDGIVAVVMPRRPGTVTKRSAPAGAHSLNEPSQPERAGTTADELRQELAAIIDWLAVDRATHKRYQPHDGVTFCNVYAHDYCHLAGVYLPRVWWTPGAIERLAQGGDVEPQYGKTIDEQRANDLFRWLRDFGLRFGWRQTGALSTLQLEVNQGAIGLIVARRKDDGRSGHIVAVVPETHDDGARRDAGGEVVAPLQSQAGATNFRYGTGTRDWWKADQFADSAFWLHA